MRGRNLHASWRHATEFGDATLVRKHPRLDALVDDPDEQIGQLARSVFDEFRAKGHGTSLSIPIEVAENNERMNASGFPVLLDVPVNRTLTVGARDGEFAVSPSRRPHEGGDNRYVCHALDDDLSVDVTRHGATSFPVG